VRLVGVRVRKRRPNFGRLNGGESCKICYTVGDVSDAIRIQMISEKDLPDCISSLGNDCWSRLQKCIDALIMESAEEGFLSFSKSWVAQAIREAREWMLNIVYLALNVSAHRHILENVLDFMQASHLFKGYDPVILFALLNDEEAIRIHRLLVQIPSWLIDWADLRHIGAIEAMKSFGQKWVDFTDPKLGW
jgi:hypothetical protein